MTIVCGLGDSFVTKSFRGKFCLRKKSKFTKSSHERHSVVMQVAIMKRVIAKNF